MGAQRRPCPVTREHMSSVVVGIARHTESKIVPSSIVSVLSSVRRIDTHSASKVRRCHLKGCEWPSLRSPISTVGLHFLNKTKQNKTSAQVRTVHKNIQRQEFRLEDWNGISSTKIAPGATGVLFNSIGWTMITTNNFSAYRTVQKNR